MKVVVLSMEVYSRLCPKLV